MVLNRARTLSCDKHRLAKNIFLGLNVSYSEWKAPISILYDMLGLKIFSYSIFSNNWKHNVYIKVRWLETRFFFASQKKKRLYFILVSIYTSTKVKSKRGERKTFGKQTIFSFGQHHYNTLHHLQPWRNNQLNNRKHHHRQNAMQYIPYFPQIHLKISPSKMILHKVFHLLS